MRETGDDVSKIADEVSAAAALAVELLHCKGKAGAELDFKTVRPIRTATDLSVDRNGDGKEDGHFDLWFHPADSSLRAMDVDLNGDGKIDWKVDFDYSGGNVPQRMTIDTNMDGKADVYLPITTSIYGRFDRIDLDGCQKLFGVSGHIDVVRTMYGSLNNFDVELKQPTRLYRKVDIMQNSDSRVAKFIYKP